MQRVLSFEQAPPLAVPLRFFLTAPLFAIAAGALLLWLGPAALASRWSPATLALTHLMTLGFLALSMIGALLQILPVVAGVEVPRPALAARAVHALVTAGTIALTAAFLRFDALLFKSALVLLVPGFGWLLVACWLGLRRAEQGSATLQAIRLALFALALTVGLGITLAVAIAWSLKLPLMQLTNLHAGWGLAGWVGLLVIGVAYQVVPMFQVTPIYSPRISRWLAPVLFLLLAAWAACLSIFPEPGAWLTLVPSLLLAAGYASFATITLNLLWRRKRPKPEPATLFWYCALIALLAALMLWFAAILLPGLSNAPAYSLMLGMLFILGFAGSVINGMLYKIVPFLVWYHLQSTLSKGEKAPNVRQVIGEDTMHRQFVVHTAALLLLLAACIWPNALARVAASAFLLSSCWMLANLAQAARVYRRHLAKRIP